ncbi:MAG TPA: cytochrome P450 [Caulobacterales bacterium]|nr:cytochrome P450 [Caulobacterales bacterium]
MADEELPNLMQLTPLNPAFRENPHALLADLRARCPVHRDTTTGSTVISRFADVRRTLSDRTLWRDPLNAEEGAILSRQLAAGYDPSLPRSRQTSILLLDDPDHARIRNPLAQALYARVAKFKPQVEAIIEGALDRIAGMGAFDLINEYAIPIPIEVIAAILGVDRARLDEFRDWSEGVILSLSPFRSPAQTAHMERASESLRAYFTELLNARRADPQDDLISDMAKLQKDASLADEELLINLSALLVAGNLTTSDLIGNAVRQFLLNPDQLAKLRADPGLINAAVEEALRFEPPVDITGRVASRDMEVNGTPLKQKQAMIFMLRAANRDPDVFERPDEFDITRKPGPHMAFGGGAHICIGAPLARLEAQVALLKLFQRFPNLRFANPDEPAHWRMLPFFRGLEKLELII